MMRHVGLPRDLIAMNERVGAGQSFNLEVDYIVRASILGAPLEMLSSCMLQPFVRIPVRRLARDEGTQEESVSLLTR